jgi:APA family basic amino acid/polyamine antiporter
VIATLIYILVAVVASGLLPAPDLAKNADAPLAAALQQGGGFSFGADLVAVGALVAITSVVLTILTARPASPSRCAATASCPRASRA